MALIRSLVGVLNQDCVTWRARHCHTHGHPTHQVDQLAIARYRFHRDHPDALTTMLLACDWYQLAPDAAHADTDLATPISPLLRAGFVSIAGIGYSFANARCTTPATGRLDEQPNASYPWLYLFTATGALAVYHRGATPRWDFHDRYDADQLRDLVPATPPPGTAR